MREINFTEDQYNNLQDDPILLDIGDEPLTIKFSEDYTPSIAKEDLLFSALPEKVPEFAEQKNSPMINLDKKNMEFLKEHILSANYHGVLEVQHNCFVFNKQHLLYAPYAAKILQYFEMITSKNPDFYANPKNPIHDHVGEEE